MKFKLLYCHGFDEAINGARLSFGRTSFDNFESSEEDKVRLSNTLAPIDGGHNGFLEFIQYWILVQSPLFWWKQLDRYRHLSQISESTMHKSWKSGLTQEMFETPIFQDTLNNLNKFIDEYNAEKTTTECKVSAEYVFSAARPQVKTMARFLRLD